MLEKSTRNSHCYFCSGFIFFCNFSNPDEEEAQAICTLRITWTTAVSLTSAMNILVSSVICHLVFVCCFYFLLLHSCPTRSNFSLSYRGVNQQQVQWSQRWCADMETAFSQCRSLWTLLPDAVTHSSVTVRELWKLVIFWTSNFNI